MPLDSSSIDRRLRCRDCQRPRLRAVALLTDSVQRAKLMTAPLCFDMHLPTLSDQDDNPLLTRVDLTCPACGGIVCVEATDRDQHEACEDCGQRYAVSYDASCEAGELWRSHYYLRPCEPPSPREVAGDLRYHERN